MTSPILKLCLGISLCLLVSKVNAQGTTCGAATSLPVNSSCVTQSFSNNEDGTSPEFVASCATGGTSYEDVWYTVTGTGNPMTVTVSGTNRAYALAALTSCAGGELDCTQQASGTTGAVNFPTTLGTTYYIHIQRRGGGTNANLSGDICAVSTGGGGGSCSANLTISTTNYSNTGLTTCGSGDDYSSSDACGSSYMNGDDYVIEYTPTTTECIQFTLTNTGTWVGIFITDDCPDAGGVNCLASETSSGGNPALSYSVTAGTTYYLTISTFPSPQCTAFDLNIASCPPPPANDECSGAISAPVNPDNLCGSIVSGTILNATASAQANACGGTANDDVWYSFVATSTAHSISLSNIVGSTTDLYHSVYSGTCGSLGTALVCSDPNSSLIGGLTIGNTYYIRIFSYYSDPGETTTFNLCIGTPPPPPANDECSGAYSATVNASGCTSTTAGSIYSATTSAQANGCFGTANDDVWFSFVATSTDVQISLNNISGSTTDLFHSVYAGTCGALGAELVCSDPNTSTVGSLTIGNVYFVRVYSYSSTSGQTTSFDLCITELGPCGATSVTEDFCPYAAILTQGPGSWSSSTYPYYGADEPGNISSEFCGSIENNSWYQFTALSTTETFNISSVTNCVDGFGIQAEVYNVTYDAGGCCTGFSSMSNCFNPGTQTTGTVTATGLTVGNTYLLMVDGNAGDNCDFTVSNWTAVGILLPVELVNFTGIGMQEYNELKWTTLSEKDNDHFSVMRSFDGENFYEIAVIAGAGASTSAINYDFIDEEVRSGNVYYQLVQHDFDGTPHTSNTISINRTQEREGILGVWPNPTESALYIEINPTQVTEQSNVMLLDATGSIVREHAIKTAGFSTVQMDLGNLQSGIYTIKYTDGQGIITTHRILKN